MTINRKQFQKWLNKFPEDTIIDIVVVVDRSGPHEAYWDRKVEQFNPINPNHFDYNNWKGFRELQLGTEDFDKTKQLPKEFK